MTFEQELIYKLEERKNELGIEEIDLKFPRLDEVFENILNMAEQESAAPEGRRRLTHILDSGISTQVRYFFFFFVFVFVFVFGCTIKFVCTMPLSLKKQGGNHIYKLPHALVDQTAHSKSNSQS